MVMDTVGGNDYGTDYTLVNPIILEETTLAADSADTGQAIQTGMLIPRAK